MNPFSIRRRARGALLLAVAALASACLNTDGPTDVSNGPFFALTTNIADSTSYPAGTVLVVRARVTHDGASIDSADVNWGVVSGGGTVSAPLTFSDTSGVASVAWTLGNTAGINVLAIAIGDVVDTLHIVGAVGEPSYLTAQGADSVAIDVGGSATLQAKVADRAGNPVPTTAVNWSASGGALSAERTLTGTDGVAAVTFQAGTAGTYFITADVADVASRIFKVVVH